jgi:hypothetical protein
MNHLAAFLLGAILGGIDAAGFVLGHQRGWADGGPCAACIFSTALICSGILMFLIASHSLFNDAT